MMFGPGAAGKSTVVKSTRIAFSDKSFDEFIREDASEVTRLIKKNIVESVLVLHEQAKKLYPIEYENLIKQMGLHKATKRPLINLILKDALDINFSSTKADLILSFWKSDIIQKVWNDHRSEFYIHDNTSEFISKCDKVIRDDYKPTKADFLKYRQETHDLEEFTLEMLTVNKRKKKIKILEMLTGNKRKKKIKILDCGGQTNHQEVYKSKQVFRDYADNSELLFVVIPVGDLESEERTGCVTQGFQILCSLLKTANEDVRVDDDFICFGRKWWTDRNVRRTINLSRQAVVVFLNKKDLLDEAIKRTGEENLVNNWYKAATANLDSSNRPPEEVSFLRDAISKSRNANPSDVAKFFFDIAQHLAESRREAISITEAGRVESAAAVVAFHSTATDTNDSSLMKWIIEKASGLVLALSLLEDLGVSMDVSGDPATLYGSDSQSVELVLEIYETLKTKEQSPEERIDLLDSISSNVVKNYLLPLKMDLNKVYKLTFTGGQKNAIQKSEVSRKFEEAVRPLTAGNSDDVKRWLAEVAECPSNDEFLVLYMSRFPGELRRRYRKLLPERAGTGALVKASTASIASTATTTTTATTKGTPSAGSDSESGEESQADERNFSVINPMTIQK